MQYTVELILIVRDLSCIARHDFPGGEHARKREELGLELLGDVEDGVEANSVDLLCRHEPLHPFEEQLFHLVVVLLSQVWQPLEPTEFELLLVVAVLVGTVNRAVGMVVRGLVERVDLGRVGLVTGVVDDHVDHHLHVALLHFGDERVLVSHRSELRVDLLEILGPVPVLAFVEVKHDG